MSENPVFQIQEHQAKLFDYTPLIPGDEVPTASYSLKLKDFLDENKPEKMELWKYPQSVTRNNFISYTVGVFGFSQGMPVIHRMYMNLIERRTGFDGYAANKAFEEAGGWEVLSDEERTYFEQAFASVFRHGANNRYGQRGSRYKSVGEELFDNLPKKRAASPVVSNTRLEWPANYGLPDEEILAYLREVRKSEQRNSSLRMD